MTETEHTNSFENNTLENQLLDDFSRQLLTGALCVLGDAANPVRLHMFASVIRELFGYTMHILAPDNEVRACEWFTAESRLGTPTRRQRTIYAIQGGLSFDYVADRLHLDMDDLSKDIMTAMGGLHKLTHVRPETIVTAESDIRHHGEATLQALGDFMTGISACRLSLAEAVEAEVHDAIYDALTAETLPALDELSSHYTIEEHYVDKINVTHIDNENIHYVIDASVSVGLQWGSNSDIRNDMGAVGEEDFSCQHRLKASVSTPSEFVIDEDDPIVVDTSSWWKDYYDPEDGITRS